jgi:hypothetical protein
MDAQESRAMLLGRSAAALELLEEIIDDPAAEPDERLKAVGTLKMGLHCLTQLAQSQWSPPDLRNGIIKLLRRRRDTIRRKQSGRACANLGERGSPPISSLALARRLQMSELHSLFGDKQIIESLSIHDPAQTPCQTSIVSHNARRNAELATPAADHIVHPDSHDVLLRFVDRRDIIAAAR